MSMDRARRLFCRGVLLTAAFPSIRPRASARGVVVVGGGFGGATAANYLRRFSPQTPVTLIEKNAVYYTCPLSNFVVANIMGMRALQRDYRALAAAGVRIIHASAQRVGGGQVMLKDGATVPYARALVAPGIDFLPDAMPGYSAADAGRIPHAWRAGAQTQILRRQLLAMPDGGVVVIIPPDNPYRCPPAPYERVSLIAHYLRRHKPKSKILILDSKENFSTQTLFVNGWEKLYRGMIEWRSAEAGGLVESLDLDQMRIETEFGEEKGEVINYIPPQQAGRVARESGLTDDSGWCPIDAITFESAQVRGVHVIGDAARAAKMPKSAFAANNQGKAAAAAMVALMRGESAAAVPLVNACYSFIAPDYAVSVAGVYRGEGQRMLPVANAGGVSPADVSAAFRRQESKQAYQAHQAIIADSFG
ncbi:MAG: FCSD flavin-binding domain-containing protein [Gammaproteobacteria bacterium]